MKVWRSRRCRAALLPALLGAIAVCPIPAQAEPLSDLPLIIDVSTPPDGLCEGPLRGTTAVWYPAGVPAQAEVEWRILAGEQPIRSGITPVTTDVVTVGFDLRQDELPADGLLRVDARSRVPGGTVGEFGRAWKFRVSRDCRPLHVVSVGDSVLWGQRLDDDRSFAQLTAEALGEQTGRGAQVHDYSVAGAVLDAPGLPAANDDTRCPAAAAPADGEDLTDPSALADRTPDVFCQLAQAATEAEHGGYPIDLVLMNGCINDLDPFLGIPVGVTPGTAELSEAVRRECAGIGAEPENPAANVPYFSSAKSGYGGRGIQAAIERAHALAGGPKVLVANYFDGSDVEGMPDGLRQRWSEFVRVSAEVFRQAATQANAVAGTAYAVSADGLFDQGASGKPVSWMHPLGDETSSLRVLTCGHAATVRAQCHGVTGEPPNAREAERFADTFLLNPVVREWFGDGGSPGTGFTASRTTGPSGLTVHFDASQAGGGIREYEWFFGDGGHLAASGPHASHTYTAGGPHLPRLLVTDMTGHRRLYELDHPVMIG
ncbi:PKD domain-containing protein [Nocardia sp. 2]|uniref:PKD domain-containing protein n=1 Tax=Nocardia acididurans TaxID=2802282 RepID=A0ABS1LZ78_9NOCA|nr:PKD domain-containing protein [Nocardia acididurans]MBL1073556.1 PKD domain-containing protein [Nocardia acididurans]